MLIDQARITVRSGDGGNGSLSFRREKYVPKGGPDGGDGGDGGDIELVVSPSVTSLAEFRHKQEFFAKNGQGGSSRKKHGKTSPTLKVRVPAGTVVWDEISGDQIADLTEENDRVIIAKGGKGGLGNWHFKTSTRQAPRIAEIGEPGVERELRLELRLIADVGLVGLPNAGKSTLLAAATRAQPKIAAYPFTTVEPNLGVVQIGGKSGPDFVMADLPGLIEGAAEGTGLGLEFLRHVSRTKVLVHVLDASGGLEARDPLSDFELINAELEGYKEDLTTRPMLVALNKSDLTEAQDSMPLLKSELEERGYRCYEISAATGIGVDDLMTEIWQELQEIRKQELEQPKPEKHRVYTLPDTDERAWTVTPMSDGTYIVKGVAIERLMNMTNFGQVDAANRFQRVLEKSGIAQELERRGISAGDTVTIAGFDLMWGEEPEIEEALPKRRTAKQRRYGLVDVEDDETSDE